MISTTRAISFYQLQFFGSNRWQYQLLHTNSGSILESKSIRAIFSEKGQKRAKYLKIWAKMYKIWKYFEKGQAIARNKRLIKYKITIIIANVQNICNLIGREEYNIGRIVLFQYCNLWLNKKNQKNNIRGKQNCIS